MTYEEKIYQFLLQAKAEIQEILIRENELERKRKDYEEYKENIKLISHGTGITVSAVILVGAFLIPQIRGDLFVFCLGLGGTIWFPIDILFNIILNRKYVSEVELYRGEYFKTNWVKTLRKLINQYSDLETSEDSQLLKEINEISVQAKWGNKVYIDWIAYFKNKYKNISTYGEIIMKLKLTSILSFLFTSSEVVEMIDKELKKHEEQHQLVYVQIETFDESNEHLFLFAKLINELQTKKDVLKDLTENQALIHNLQNIIDINLKKIEKTRSNAILINKLTDNLNPESKKQSLQQIEDFCQEAQQTYQEVMNLIHETISIINDQQNDVELNINESFQEVLKSYKDRM